MDGPLYHFLHEHYTYQTRPIPDALKVPTRVLRSLEDWGENVYILAVVYAMWRIDRSRRSRVALIGLASLIVAVSIESAKRVSGRERPEVSHGKLIFHGPRKWLQKADLSRSEGQHVPTAGDYQSFPSGHTAAAAVYSGSLAAFYPPLRPMCVALATGCAANRIWKERHFLSDCWAGGIFGFWFAYTLPRRRWVQPFVEWFDGRFSRANASPAICFGPNRANVA